MTFFLRKYHRDEYFNKKSINKPIYRYHPFDPLYSIYEEYNYFGRSVNTSANIRKINFDLYLKNENKRPISDDIDCFTKRKTFKDRRLNRIQLFSKTTKNAFNVIHLKYYWTFITSIQLNYFKKEEAYFLNENKSKNLIIFGLKNISLFEVNNFSKVKTNLKK